MVSEGRDCDSDGVPRYMQDLGEWYEDTKDDFSSPGNGVGVYKWREYQTSGVLLIVSSM